MDILEVINDFLCLPFSLFQCCRVIHVAPLVSFQMESFMARGTTWGIKSDTAVSQGLYWKDTVSSHASYRLEVEHNGTSHRLFAEARHFFFLSFHFQFIDIASRNFLVMQFKGLAVNTV